MFSFAKPPRNAGLASDRIQVWNRKLHYYLGLYFLFFIWLFALTGLLLNHNWKPTEFWSKRRTATTEHSIQPPTTGRPLDDAKQLMAQLSMTGEIQWVAAAPAASSLDFRVSRPGLQFEIKADRAQGRATVQRTEVNTWGILRALHTFTGVRMNDAKNSRDWSLTTVWVFAMDAVAVGLLAMVASGVVIWYQSRAQRTAGMITLASGVAVCAWFLVGLAWLFA